MSTRPDDQARSTGWAGPVAELGKRFAIPPELLAGAGVRRVTDAEAREMLGLNGYRGADLGGILFPYISPISSERVGGRIRLDRPLPSGGKYMSEPGCRWLFVPPISKEWLGDAGVPVVFIEAEKSALALLALAERHGRRLVPISCGGCWGWRRTVTRERQPDGTLAPVIGPSPSLDWIGWAGRRVVIAFDSNSATNPDVRKARRALAIELAGRGASVEIADLPALEGVNGPDDLIAVSGDEATLAMLDAARPFPECALAEAEQAVAALEADKKSDPLPAAEAIPAVPDLSRRALLIGRLAALRIPGLTKKQIERGVAKQHAEADAQRKAAAEAARRGRLLRLKVNGAELLNDLTGFIRRFVILTLAQAHELALWILHTHTIEAADYTPYQNIKSPVKRSAKSLLLEVLELLCPRAWRCDRTTAAALLRSIERDLPTLLLDEYDAAQNSGDEYGEAMRGLLNSGFRRGGTYRLCVGEDREPRDFRTFCPKAIACIGDLPDTVADRSIPIRLRRKARSEVVERFRRRKVEPEAALLRERCEAWTLQSLDRLREIEPALPEELNDRQQDVAEPLLAIADLVGGEWPQRIRAGLVELCTGEPAAESIGEMLLVDIARIFAQRGTDRLSSCDLAEGLGAMEDRPWAEWRAGKPITKTQLAHQLGRFGITPGTIRLADGTTPKGYMREAFADAWLRYLPPSPPSNDTPSPSIPVSNRHTATARINIGDGAILGSATDPPCGGSEKCEIANTGGPCGGVAFSNGENEAGAHSGDLFDGQPNPPGPKPTPVPCAACGMVFLSRVALANHINAGCPEARQ